jgi:BirA family biotin operon repressor/biotin-[acetyl-CoA-carboxylase] ligase
MTPGQDDISLWQRLLQEDIAARAARLAADESPPLIQRAIVVPTAASTQDLAREDATAHGCGSMVVALRQTQGRGRLGRPWADTSHLGLAASFSLPGDRFDASTLSIASGLAALHACDEALGETSHTIGLRWPNDVVERGGPGRKLSGVLIESFGRSATAPGVVIVGIGINVLHHESDFPLELRSRAASLAMLGSGATRLQVACALLGTLEEILLEPTEALATQWQASDVLVGERRTFLHASEPHTGTVEAIEPSSHILLRLDDGRLVRLPALTTSMVHEP